MARPGKSKLAAEALNVLRRQRQARQITPSDGGGMTEVLLLTVLGRGTSIQAAKTALARIKDSIVNWNELRVMPPSEVASYLKGIKDAQSKAEAIHDVLVNIFEGTHDLRLGFLEGVSAEEARDFLQGLGSLTDTMVDEAILSGRGHFHMAADGEVNRVARRLGIGNAKTPAKCQEELEKALGQEKAYQMMYLMKGVGEGVCNARSPKCGECALSGICAGARKTSKRK